MLLQCYILWKMFTGENVINIIIFESIIQPRFFFVLIKKFDYRKLDNFTLELLQKILIKGYFHLP